MGDVAGKEPFEQVAKRLLNEFLDGRNDDETQEVIGQAYLEYILKRERIRRDVTERGQHRDAVDYETLQKLKNADSDDPTHAHAMLTFQRFGFDPKKAMEYIKSNPLASKIVGKELKLEIGLIANGDALAFASEYRDIANVIEYIDWNAVNSKVLAKFYREYKIELLVQVQCLCIGLQHMKV